MIRNWIVLDLDVFRRHENDPFVRKEIQDNHDGTHFIAYDIRSFPPGLIAGISPTMAIALERGVNAVERLPIVTKARKLAPPPDLQALVLKHGGYHLVTREAWAEWDADLADWKARVRNGEIETE